MILYTIGFTQKNAETFFSLLRESGAELLIDIRLHNTSQLAGFTRGSDLPFFLWELCGCRYVHEPAFAPTDHILKRYKKKEISWATYETEFHELMEERDIYRIFTDKYASYGKVVLLCSEPEPDMCHRRLVAEYLAEKGNYEIVHL